MTWVASSRVGYQDQPSGTAGPRPVACEAGQHREPERERLARAGLAAAEEVATGERVGQRRGLDGERLGEAVGGERPQERLGQAERGERGHARRGRGPQDLGCGLRLGGAGLGLPGWEPAGRRRRFDAPERRRTCGDVTQYLRDGRVSRRTGRARTRRCASSWWRLRNGRALASSLVQRPTRSAVSGRVTSAAARSPPAARRAARRDRPRQTAIRAPRTTRRCGARHGRGTPARCGLPTTSTTCGRSITTNRPSWTSRLNAERSPWARPSRASPSRASTSWNHRSASSSGSGRSWASRGAARPSSVPRYSSSSSVPTQLHGVGHRHARPPEPGERAELGVGPLARQQLTAERRAGGHRAHLAGTPNPAALEVARIAVEHAVLGAAVALGGHERAPVGAGYRALEEVDVGLLAGLEHAEVGVDGGVVGDHPAGTGPGAVLGAVPGRPAVAFGRAVVLCDVLAAALVERGQVERVTGVGRSGLVVVEATAAPAGGFESEVVLAQRGVSWVWAPRTVQPGGAG